MKLPSQNDIQHFGRTMIDLDILLDRLKERSITLRILAVYDDDPAGDEARQRLGSVPRVEIIPPPEHDLTDYWRSGRNLKEWLEMICS